MERLMLTNELVNFIKQYYNKRKLVWPDFNDSMEFVHTEIGEVYELDLSRKTWVRNNPELKEKFSEQRLAEELGDVIMMIMVAGIAEGVDPLTALIKKMCRKLGEYKNDT